MKKKYTYVSGDHTATVVRDYEKEIKSNMDFTLGVAGQYNINSAFAVGANVAAVFAAKEEGSYSFYDGQPTASAVTTTDKSHTDVTLGLNAKYNVTSNLLVGVDYSHMFSADITGSARSVSGSTVTNYNTTMTDRKADMFGFNLAYRF